MPILEGVYPANMQPGKYQIERMYRIGYILHGPSFVKPTDAETLGLEIEPESRSCALRVYLNTPTPKLRKHVADIWKRLGEDGQKAFVLTYVAGAAGYICEILDERLAQASGLGQVAQALDTLANTAVCYAVDAAIATRKAKDSTITEDSDPEKLRRLLLD